MLALVVNDVSSAANGRAVGTIVKVGAVHGDAFVSLSPPDIGTFDVPVTASFAVDVNWKGTGTFTYWSRFAHPSRPSPLSKVSQRRACRASRSWPAR